MLPGTRRHDAGFSPPVKKVQPVTVSDILARLKFCENGRQCFASAASFGVRRLVRALRQEAACCRGRGGPREAAIRARPQIPCHADKSAPPQSADKSAHSKASGENHLGSPSHRRFSQNLMGTNIAPAGVAAQATVTHWERQWRKRRNGHATATFAMHLSHSGPVCNKGHSFVKVAANK